MGTRSITRIQENGVTLTAIYRQFDGYISGHGKDLANFLRGRTIVNGYVPGTESSVFNGPGCLAANLIAFLKRPEYCAAGNIYIYPTDAFDEEYSYDINISVANSGKRRGFIYSHDYVPLPTVTVRDYTGQIFSGSSVEYDEFIQKSIG